MSLAESITFILMAYLLLVGVVCAASAFFRISRRAYFSRKVRALVDREWLPMDAFLLVGTLFIFMIPSFYHLLLNGPRTEIKVSHFRPEMALTLIPHIGVVIFVLAMLKMRSWSWRAAFGKITVFRDLLCGVRGLFALVPFMLVLLLVWIELMVALNLDGSTQEVVQLLASPETGLFVKLFFGFFAVVVASVSEELAFRGVLLPSIKLEFMVETNFVVAGAITLLWFWLVN